MWVIVPFDYVLPNDGSGYIVAAVNGEPVSIPTGDLLLIDKTTNELHVRATVAKALNLL